MYVWMESFGRIVAFQALGCAAVLVLALVAPQLGSRGPGARTLRALSRRFDRIARRRRLAVLLVGVLALAEGAAVLLVYFPEPKVHDEFSYLLAADTFASGRLSNPTHPMWPHFESFHVIQRPTYASKFPPGQGLALAAGQWLGGNPIVGVKLGFALACAAICWMLQAWMPARWALLGGLLAVGQLGGFGYWSQSYWGGSVAALGGALLFGALRRLVRRPRALDAACLAIGLAILANSRPYEGLILSLPVAVLLGVWLLGRDRPPPGLALRAVVAPIVGVLAVTAGLMALYHLNVTGDALRMPYQVYAAAHAQEAQISLDVGRQSLAQLVVSYQRLWFFYLGLPLTLPLVALLWSRDRWAWFAALAVLTAVAGLLTETWVLPHYAAPLTGVVFIPVLHGMRQLRTWRWRGRPGGRLLVRGLVMVFFASALLTRALQYQWVQWEQRRAAPWNFDDRARILAQLEGEPGEHLVLVRYGPDHNAHFEWVYNAADIDGAKVVWARELDPARNRALLEYFSGRRVWLLEADEPSPRPVPYR